MPSITHRVSPLIDMFDPRGAARCGKLISPTYVVPSFAARDLSLIFFEAAREMPLPIFAYLFSVSIDN